MGICCSRSDFELSVPTPEKTRSPQPASIPDGTTSTLSPRPGTAMSARALAHAAFSQRRHDDGWGDLFTSQRPDRQEVRSRQYPSGRMSPLRWIRSVSMDVTALQSAPSHLSRRRNRTASTAGHGDGHRRVGIQSMSGLSSATGQITAGRQRGRRRFPSTLQSLLSNDFRYAVGRCPISP
jgi:hypothetical protein